MVRPVADKHFMNDAELAAEKRSAHERDIAASAGSRAAAAAGSDSMVTASSGAAVIGAAPVAAGGALVTLLAWAAVGIPLLIGMWIIIPIAVQGASRQRKREAPKGRRVDPQALSEVQALLGDMPAPARPADRAPAQDPGPFGCLSTAHLAALAQEMRWRRPRCTRSPASIITSTSCKEGEDAPAALTVRVCDGLSCEMAGAQ
jgi:hypothetical protein